MYHREDTGIHPRAGSLLPLQGSLATANKLNCKFPPSSRGLGCRRNALPRWPQLPPDYSKTLPLFQQIGTW